MRKIILPLFILLLVGCGKSKNETSSSSDSDSIKSPVVVAVSKDTTAFVKVDAVTSATSKPNELIINGKIDMLPQNKATVALTLGGVIKSINVVSGQFVRRGAVIAYLQNPEFVELQKNYLDSQAKTEYLKAEYERQKALSSEQAASQKKLQQSKAEYFSMKSHLEAYSTQLSLMGVSLASINSKGIHPYFAAYAPIAGYISNLNVNIGKYVQAGESLCEIIDKSDQILNLNIFEKDIAYVVVGDMLQFKVNGMENEIFHAKVTTIDQNVDPIDRTINVYAKILKTKRQFKPGMYVTARVEKVNPK